jgi:hypothetical protein
MHTGAVNFFILNTKITRNDPRSTWDCCIINNSYRNYVLGKSSGIDDMGSIRWQLALCLLLAWTIVFLCLSKGVQSSGKVRLKPSLHRNWTISNHNVTTTRFQPSRNESLHQLASMWNLIISLQLRNCNYFFTLIYRYFVLCDMAKFD